MNIVIFGASGFVGRSLVPFLVSQGYSVTIISRSDISFPSVRCILVPDLFDFNLYYNSLQSADLVIYLAGLAHITNKNSFESLPLYMASNFYPLAFVSQLCASIGVKRFIFFSTAKVLGEFSETGTKFSNLSQPNPSNSYSLSKYRSEQFLQELSSVYSTDFVILRPPLIYGCNPKGNIQSLIKLMKYRIPLPVLSLSSNKRSMLSMDNLNQFIIAIINFPRPINFPLLICDDLQFSTLDFIRFTANTFGFRPILFPFPPFILSFLFKLFYPNLFSSLICSFEIDSTSTRNLLRADF